jgi:hypothetical protein
MSASKPYAPRSRETLEKLIVDLRHMESILSVEITLSARRFDVSREQELRVKKLNVQSSILEARAELEQLNKKKPYLRLVK